MSSKHTLNFWKTRLWHSKRELRCGYSHPPPSINQLVLVYNLVQYTLRSFGNANSIFAFPHSLEYSTLSYKTILFPILRWIELLRRRLQGRSRKVPIGIGSRARPWNHLILLSFHFILPNTDCQIQILAIYKRIIILLSSFRLHYSFVDICTPIIPEISLLLLKLERASCRIYFCANWPDRPIGCVGAVL